MVEIEQELAGERAGALGRVASGMERALAELRAFDAANRQAGADAAAGAEREQLVAAAAEQVWFYVVQRECLGAYRHHEALRFYDVPAEVERRIGPRRRSRPTRARPPGETPGRPGGARG